MWWKLAKAERLAARPPCRHGCGRPACRPKGLCWTCSMTPEIRALYPSASKFSNKQYTKDADADADPRPERMPGDALWPCLWCRAWRCHSPLRLCFGCEAVYAAAAVGMPEFRAEE